MRTLTSPPNQIRNASGETIPAWGIARVTGLYRESPNKQPILNVEKPDGSDSLYVVVYGADLADGDQSVAVRLLDATVVAIDETETIVVPDEVGPVEDKWTAGIDGAGLIVLSDIEPAGTRSVIGKSSDGQTDVWGYLDCDSGAADLMLKVALYPEGPFFTGFPYDFRECGSGSGSGSGPEQGGCSFPSGGLEEFGLAMCLDGPVVWALVPAGYKKGPVILKKMRTCKSTIPLGSGSGSGSGSGGKEWDGWVVWWGSRMKVIISVPTYTCCPVTKVLQITTLTCSWVIGGPVPGIFTPCGGVGSGSGSAE